MRDKRDSIVHGTLTVLAVILVIVVNAAGQETTLYSFTKKTGTAPEANLVFDSTGNLYGTTYFGGEGTCNTIGDFGCGTVFKLIPGAGGVWTEEVLHFFSNKGGDGNQPLGGVVLDAAGNIYGTTQYGGSNTCGTTAEGFSGCGTVFELMPTGGGVYREKVIHTFVKNGVDGEAPEAGLVFDSAGNLYGTTVGGGDASYAYGTVFELTPSGDGNWTETILHNFDGCCNTDGIDPESSLIFDSAGNLYGTTLGGGPNLSGTVYELSPSGSGTWTEVLLYSFGGSVGYDISGGVAMDASGNLYGTTNLGGGGGGALYELSPVAGGGWTETTLYSFGRAKGPSRPVGNLILDASGNVYGTTTEGGTKGGGTVFELQPQAGGTWTLTLLHDFPSGPKDGIVPAAGLVSDAAGNLYGTTYRGGAREDGAVFEIVH
jgi:uncharacterized repeat protein (TIGR03803 family)